MFMFDSDGSLYQFLFRKQPTQSSGCLWNGCSYSTIATILYQHPITCLGWSWNVILCVQGLSGATNLLNINWIVQNDASVSSFCPTIRSLSLPSLIPAGILRSVPPPAPVHNWCKAITCNILFVLCRAWERAECMTKTNLVWSNFVLAIVLWVALGWKKITCSKPPGWAL